MNKIFFKPVHLIIGMVIYINVQSQELLTILPLNKNTNKIEYSEVIKVEGSPSQLYTRAIMWINTFFKNSSSVTKVRDEANGIIEGQHRLRLINKLEDGTDILFGHVQYNFKFEFKQDRYRYIITEFVLVDQSRQGVERMLNPKDSMYNTNTVSHLEQINTFIKDLIASLKKAMEPKVEVKDEW